MIKDKDDTNEQSAKMPPFENKLLGHKDVLMTRERFSRDKCGGIQVGTDVAMIRIIINHDVYDGGSVFSDHHT